MNKNNPEKISGSNSGDIRCLKPILEEWIKCVSELAEEWKHKKKVPWWYNERASLSVFAGAIWRAGGLCFEEYSDPKRTMGGRNHRSGSLYHGRVDLYFSWHGFDFIAEAKSTYSGFSRNDDRASDRLARWLKKSRDDVRPIPRNGQRKLAILFARPFFKKSCESQIDEKLNKWVEMLQGLDTNAYAWVFPPCARNTWSSDDDFCPGEAVLIKEVRRD
jgi:hypothetical protein